VSQEKATNTSLRFYRRTEQLVTDDNYIDISDAGNYFGPLEILVNVRLSSVRNALRVALDYYGPTEGSSMREAKVKTLSELAWSSIPEDRFDTELSLQEPTSLTLTTEDELLISVNLWISGRDPLEPFPEMEGLLSSWSRSRNAELVELEASLWTADLWTAFFRLPLRGKNILFAQTFGEQVVALADAFIDGPPSVNSIIHLLDCGNVRALIGAAECGIFECKRSLMIDQERAKLELAKDVAAIANGEDQGVIVIGLETKTKDGKDYVVKVHPIPDAHKLAKRARRTIDRYVFPQIEGLTVRSCPQEGGDIIYIHIPPQPQELKPFLIGGAFIDGKIEGAIISVPRRRDDDTISLSPASLHAFLAAGYAYFRGKQ
jgi:hypothetical protein